MINVSFSYDPETNTVSNVVATGAAVKAKAEAPVKAKSKNKTTKVVLNGSSLQLNQDVCDLLGVTVGDRLCVRFAPQPVLVRPDIANEPKGGNLITKSLTVSVKGKTGEELATYGTDFEYSLKSEGYLLVGEHTAQEDKPVDEDKIIDDEDFLETIEANSIVGEEVDFTFDI